MSRGHHLYLFQYFRVEKTVLITRGFAFKVLRDRIIYILFGIEIVISVLSSLGLTTLRVIPNRKVRQVPFLADHILHEFHSLHL
jgi:hypothetical protein